MFRVNDIVDNYSVHFRVLHLSDNGRVTKVARAGDGKVFHLAEGWPDTAFRLVKRHLKKRIM